MRLPAPRVKVLSLEASARSFGGLGCLFLAVFRGHPGERRLERGQLRGELVREGGAIDLVARAPRLRQRALGVLQRGDGGSGGCREDRGVDRGGTGEPEDGEAGGPVGGIDARTEIHEDLPDLGGSRVARLARRGVVGELALVGRVGLHERGVVGGDLPPEEAHEERDVGHRFAGSEVGRELVGERLADGRGMGVRGRGHGAR